MVRRVPDGGAGLKAIIIGVVWFALSTLCFMGVYRNTDLGKARDLSLLLFWAMVSGAQYLLALLVVWYGIKWL